MEFSALKELLSAELIDLSLASSYQEIVCSGLSFDTRSLQKGDIYFSVPGMKEDGTKFIEEAIARGASVIITPESNQLREQDGIPVLKVKDVRKALALACNSFYKDPSSKLRMIGITGTNGKTSTCWILSKILSHISGPTIYLGTLGTVIMRKGQEERLSPEVQTTRDPLFNNQMLSKALEHGCLNAVMEVTSHGLTQFRTYGINWDVCAYTNLTQEHLDYHLDMVEYGAAKKKLFTEELRLSSKKEKKAVLNADNTFGQELIGELLSSYFELCIFSKDVTDVDLYQQQVSLNTFTSTLLLKYKSEKFEFSSPLLGAFNYENLLCAVGVLLSLGYCPTDITESGKYVESVPGRIELISESLPRVFVDYAHTPDALDKIQDVLREMLKEGERLITVFGCGGDRDSKKRPLMGKSVLVKSDVGVVTSDNPRTEDPKAIIEDIMEGIVSQLDMKPKFQLVEEIDRKEAIRKAIELAKKNDIVLIAGKGHEDYQILGDEKIFFCDRTIGREFLVNKER